MIDHVFPTRRDELAMTLARLAVLYVSRDKDDDRGKNEFQADGLIEEGWVEL